MLKHISITNYLLIDALELDVRKGFTAITGETGSGKSILIGALGLAMGGRADSGVARDATKRCVVELEVDLRKLGLGGWFEEQGIPAEAMTIMRRQIDPGGRSRAFINDTPVKLDQLRALGEHLVHVHSQHHTLLLNDTAFQLGLVDHVAGVTAKVIEYRERYEQWKAQRIVLDALNEEDARAQTELDYLRFQLEELEAANPLADEQATLEQALTRSENAEVISAAYQGIVDGVEGEQGALHVLNALKQSGARTGRLDDDLHQLYERLEAVRIELKDIAAEAEQRGAQVDNEPQQAERLRERLDLLLRLQQKHRVADNAGLITLRDDLRKRTGHINSLGERIATLEAEERTMHAGLVSKASVLSVERVRALEPLASFVTNQLRELGMPHARFVMEHTVQALGPHGTDSVRALFSANKDRGPAALDKVASGGELSRVMLALIGLAAESKQLPTVIFDEVDTGVSGETADRVGLLMKQMARGRQVVAITHLPQIAGKADTHLLVSKDHQADPVTTDIRHLADEERVEALARMLSGQKTTKAALENAKELLKK